MKLRRILALGVTTSLVVTMVPMSHNMTSFAAQQHSILDNNLQSSSEISTLESQDTALVKSKSEVVYAKLSAEGTTNAVYVVNHFEVGKSGNMIDFGDYQSVQNLTDTSPISLDQEKVTFPAKEGNFYYQGNMKATDLPWNFDITYMLDDQLITANELAGKSGKLEIQITTEQNTTVTPEFYEGYMLQISLTLDNEKSSNLSAEGAVVAEAGNRTMLNYTVMPSKDADIRITCVVKEFEMKGIEISAMPFSLSMELPDTNSMLSEFQKLPQAISDLNDGVGELADGTAKLSKGATKIKNGSTDVNQGLAELKKNSTKITGASSKIGDALTTISTSLTSNQDNVDLSQLTKLPTALKELSTGIKGIAKGMDQLKDGYIKAYSALDTAIIALPETAITTEQIKEQFPDMNESQKKLLDQLYASYVAGQVVKGTYNQSKLAFAQVAPTMETLSKNLATIAKGLDEMSSKFGSNLSSTDITTQLSQLTLGLTKLASNYSEFDKGLKEYIQGVGQLADGYRSFDSGLSEFVDGVGVLDQGVNTLHEGTQQFSEKTADMPEQIQGQVDQLMKDFTGTKVGKISFVSQKNTNTDLVQFVLKCEDIKIPVKNTAIEQAKEDSIKEETIWDRFAALFE